MEKGVLKFEIALELFLKIFLGRTLLEKGILKFEIALDNFFIFYGWQPLDNKVLKFEIALELSFKFLLGGNSWKRES